MSYDYSKLSGKIKEVCGSQAAFAEALGVSERTVSIKLNNKNDWKQGEIMQCCKILKIRKERIPMYFFTPLC